MSGQLSASAELGSPRGRVGDGQTGLPAICDTQLDGDKTRQNVNREL